ncbi:hypothetical protein PZ938_10205 [Luteipulveratus sp. YIM 133132]|uniref:hypothetical protein n=1 Tax=Luteipulveratus flavus TaxID=3031728 RepID=UPI0023B14F4E|nr:hypothetical protein [Luteipulveratus sp. YIM 133132]MDE9365975.1 hypothetical protein [Luteipulveratus sp. YIM 133132]
MLTDQPQGHALGPPPRPSVQRVPRSQVQRFLEESVGLPLAGSRITEVRIERLWVEVDQVRTDDDGRTVWASDAEAAIDTTRLPIDYES